MPLHLQHFSFSNTVVVPVLRHVMEISFTVTLAFLFLQFHQGLAATEAFIKASYLPILNIFSELQF